MAIKSIFAAVEAVKRTSRTSPSRNSRPNSPPAMTSCCWDIREIQEQVDLGTIPGARHAPRGMLEFWADPGGPYYRDWFEEDRRTVLFCAAGGRSALAVAALADMGFSNVAHLESDSAAGVTPAKRSRT